MPYTPAVDFIPEVWSGMLTETYTEQAILKQAVSTAYQGEIANAGDVVKIPNLVNPAVTDYTGADFAWTAQAGGTTDLAINQAKMYTPVLNKVDLAQGAVKNTQAHLTRKVAQEIIRAQEAFVFGSTVLGSGAHSANVYTTATCGTATVTGTTGATVAVAGVGRVQMVIDSTGTAPGKWVKNTAYALKTRILIADAHTSGVGMIYECTKAGTSENSDTPYIAANWPTVIGNSVVDAASGTYSAGVTPVWTCIGVLGLGVGATATKVSKTNVYEHFTVAKKLLSEAKAWSNGDMVAVVSPAIIQLIESSTELTHATSKADDVISKGFFGTLNGFNILPCLNLSGSTASDTNPMNMYFGTRETICFAENFTEGPTAVEVEKNFQIGIKGLSLYGATVPYDRRFGGIRWEVNI